MVAVLVVAVGVLVEAMGDVDGGRGLGALLCWWWGVYDMVLVVLVAVVVLVVVAVRVGGWVLVVEVGLFVVGV